jgi:NDP-sugar pyrophosphorylase family protein
MKAADLFALPPSLAPFAAHFVGDVAPWEWLRRIDAALAALPDPVRRADVPAGVHVEGRVWLHPTVKLPPHATILGPTWIGAGSEIRPGAFIRGNVIAGERCVLGHASEFKHCVLLDGVQAPHFNYVGDSILGNGAHLGAGVICSNLRLDQQPVVVRGPAGDLPTGLVKLGAILGDRAEVGCNAVLNPGSVLGKRALVMPTMAFSGFLPEATMAHVARPVRFVPRRD